MLIGIPCPSIDPCINGIVIGCTVLGTVLVRLRRPLFDFDTEDILSLCSRDFR